MAKKCSVEFCTHMGGLYAFPRIEHIKEQWTKFCERGSDWSPGPGARICTLHFTTDSFVTRQRKTLKKSAVPTIRFRGKFKVCSVLYGSELRGFSDADLDKKTVS